MLAAHLRAHVENKSRYLFPTSSTRNRAQDRASLARRFRAETLRRARVPEDLTKVWLGHSKESITDFYAGGLQNDLAWRQEWCERAGLGFELHGLRFTVPLVIARAA